MSPDALKELLNRETVSPYHEMLAYEFLYSMQGSSLKKIAAETVLSRKLSTEAMQDKVGFVAPDIYDEVVSFIDQKLRSQFGKLSVAVNNTPSWPKKLADSERPTPLFYYYGDIGLTEAKSVSIVGSRKVSEDGVNRAWKMAKELTTEGVTVVSGLAEGVDTVALESALEHKGRVIGVIGTPIDEYYPVKNKSLQDRIGTEHLLVSQVPFYRYSKQPFKTKKYYFPERNELMAAISDATVIIEASNTSGTLTQARACLHQKRPLFILRSCYESTEVSWPKKYANQENVYIIDSSESILSILGGE